MSVSVAIALAYALQATPTQDDTRAHWVPAIADAGSRSSLLSKDMTTGGHDGSFFLGSGDDAFRLEFTGYTQWRYVANIAGNDSAGWHTGGFTNRRTRLTAQGHLVDPSLIFKVTQSFGRRDGIAGLSDGYIQKDFEKGVSMRFGQFKLPFWREELHSAKRLLAVERSIAREVFSLGRSPAVMLSVRGERERYALAASNGRGSANAGFATDPTDFALTARGEWLIAGAFDPFERAGATSGQEFSWLASAALHAEESPVPGGMPDSRIITWTTDTALRGDGWSLLAAYIGRRDSSGDAGRSTHDHALLVQGAVLVSEDVELVARYDAIIPDKDRTGGGTFSTLTIGANWYVHGDSLKLSADLSWHPDTSSGNDLVGAFSGTGFLGVAGGDEIVIRVQAQLVF